MNLNKARVVKRDTEDGVNFLLDEVPIGFIYELDADSIHDLDWLDKRTGKTTKRATAIVYGSATNKGSAIGWMPLELFALEDLTKQ